MGMALADKGGEKNPLCGPSALGPEFAAFQAGWWDQQAAGVKCAVKAKPLRLWTDFIGPPRGPEPNHSLK
jgi:hypothetical protein